jgi:hypothetical protein
VSSPVHGTAEIERALRSIERARIVLVSSLRGPAGGRFLYTLLDGHPDAHCYPFKLSNVVSPEDFAAGTRADLVARLLSRDMLFDTRRYGVDLGRLGARGEASIQIDRARFRESLELLLDRVPWSFRNYLLAIAAAHNLALGIHPEGDAFIFYAHELRLAVRHRESLGDATLLAIHRHPINLYASGVRYTRERSVGERWRAFAERAGVDLATAARDKKVVMPYRLGSLFDFYRTLERAGGSLGVVLLERLHAEPEASMRLVADHLGLRWSDTLLHGTIHGLPWGGKGTARLSGFSPDLHRTVDHAAVGRGGAAKIGFCTGRLHSHLGYQRERSSWTGAFGVDRVALRYYRDVWQVLREIALDRSSGLGLSDRLAIWRDNLENAARYPFQRIADTMTTAAADRRLATENLAVINPFRPEVEYFDRPETSVQGG